VKNSVGLSWQDRYETHSGCMIFGITVWHNNFLL